MQTKMQEKAEDRIIDLIQTESGGRLVTYKPENSSKDLVVEKKGDYKVSPLSFKVYCCDALSPQTSILEMIDKTIPGEDHFYILVVAFDIIKQDIQDSLWMIPSHVLQLVTEEATAKYMMSKKDLGIFLVEKLLS